MTSIIEELPGRRSPDEPAILCDNLVRIYKVADQEVVALAGLDLRVEPGEMVAIVGASGSGKSTLMNILGGLDAPTAGRAIVAGHDVGRLRESARATYRRRVIGFVWQQTDRNLLPYLSAVENVELPLLLDGAGSARRSARARELLELVGLDDERARLRAGRLSGGEQQQVAVAVALANGPGILLADEATGELDGAGAAQLFEVLRRVNRELETTILLVSHDPLVAGHVQRTVAIRDGRTSTETVHRPDLRSGIPGEVTSEEYAILDQAGRLQLPRAYVEALGLRRRVRLRLETDHVTIWPGDHRSGPSQPPATTPPTTPRAENPGDADG